MAITIAEIISDLARIAARLDSEYANAVGDRIRTYTKNLAHESELYERSTERMLQRIRSDIHQLASGFGGSTDELIELLEEMLASVATQIHNVDNSLISLTTTLEAAQERATERIANAIEEVGPGLQEAFRPFMDALTESIEQSRQEYEEMLLLIVGQLDESNQAFASAIGDLSANMLFEFIALTNQIEAAIQNSVNIVTLDIETEYIALTETTAMLSGRITDAIHSTADTISLLIETSDERQERLLTNLDKHYKIIADFVKGLSDLTVEDIKVGIDMVRAATVLGD